MEQIYDLIIIGAGVAGLSAAITAKRAGLETLVIEKNDTPGGEIACLNDISEFPGFPSISGSEISSMLKEHADLYGCEYLSDTVKEVSLLETIKTVKTSKKEISATGIILSCGSFPDFDFRHKSIRFNQEGRVNTGEDCRTDISHVYAAGDIRNKLYNEIVNAISDGSNAVKSFLVDIS